MKCVFYRLILLMVFIFSAGDILAQETSIMIRAKAKDAKFIGTSIGGAKILVKDAQTGEILSEGFTQGSTGDTQLIMNEAHERSASLTDENTAGFEAVLKIDAPVFVTVEAHAPVSKKQAKVLSSTQLWVIPGKDIKGDGVVLDVPGFVVDVLSPQTHERIEKDESIEIRANVVMMCGCPLTEGGIWDAGQYEVKAIISSEGEKIEEISLQLQDKQSTFLATADLEPGLYEIVVYAYDPVSGNTGLDKTNIIVN